VRLSTRFLRVSNSKLLHQLLEVSQSNFVDNPIIPTKASEQRQAGIIVLADLG
jgi:hypothetical protein